jgi:hypothetical protein
MTRVKNVVGVPQAMIIRARNIAGSHFRQYLLLIVLIGIVMLPRLLNLDTFIGPDEKAIWGWGNYFALELSQGNWHRLLIGDGYPAVTLMWLNTIGVTLKWLWLQVSGQALPFTEVIGLERPLDLYAERRFSLAFFNGLQILAAYPLLQKIWNQRVATVAVGLMAIEPLALTFARMIRADAVLSGFMLLSILATITFLKTGKQRYNWLAGAMGSLAALSKSSGGITAPIAVAIYVAVAWHRSRQAGWRQSLAWLGEAVLGWGTSAAILYFGLWPAWWTQPIDTFSLLWGKLMFHAVEATANRANTYFWGTVHPFGPGPWFYPALALLRLTPWLLLGGVAAIGRWLCQAVRLRNITFAPNTLAILFYTATYWLAITLPGQKIDRFFVPVISGLAVLTAIEAVNVADWFKSRLSTVASQSVWPRLVAIGIGGLLVGHVSFYHPLYSTYFNPLIGGPRFWQWALPVGNGEGVDEALNYLTTSTDVTDHTLVCGTNFPRCQPFYAGELWPQKELRSARWFEADYALWHIDEQQLGVFPEGVLAYLRRQSPIYVAHYHGLDYTWLYAIPQPAYLTGGSKLEGVAILFGYDVEEKSLADLSPGDWVKLHLYWQNEGQATLQRYWWRVVDGEGYVWNEAVAQPLPEFETEASQDSAVIEGKVSLSLPPDMPPGTYYLKAGFADARGDVGQFALPTEGSLLEVKGVSVGASHPANELNGILNSALVLKGYDLSSPEGTPGETLWVTLHWQTIEQPQGDFIITLHLLNKTEQEVSSWSQQPVHNTYPTSQWPANANVRDPWRISLPPDLSPGQYRFRLELGSSTISTAPPQINLGTVRVIERKISFDVPPMQFKTNYSFDEIATLLGYDLSGHLLPDGAHVRITLYWQALQATTQPYTINVRLVDGNGAVLAEQESQPAAGKISTTEWQAGEIVTDLHEMDVTRSEPVSVKMEIRLLDAAGKNIPSPDGAETFVVSDIQQKVMWRMSAP